MGTSKSPARSRTRTPSKQCKDGTTSLLRCRLQAQLIIGAIPSAQLTTLALGAVASHRCDAAELRGASSGVVPQCIRGAVVGTCLVGMQQAGITTRRTRQPTSRSRARSRMRTPSKQCKDGTTSLLRCRLQAQLIIGAIPSAQLTTLALGAVASRRCDAAELRGAS